MKYKFFSILLMCIMTTFVGIGFAGCGDIYADLRVTVDSTSVSLRLSNNTQDADGDTEGDSTEDNTDSTDTLSNTAIIHATVTGASADMLKSVTFWYEDSSIVSAEVTSLNDNVSTIRLTAQSAGVTRIRVISREYGQAVSEDIVVTVYRDATEMRFKSTATPSVALGESLTLNTSELIDFYVNGEKTNVYPNTATFSLLTPDDDRWNSAYGNEQPTGVTLENNVLSVDANAQCGIVQLIATMQNGLSTATPIYVMIYEPIETDQIVLLQDGEPVDAINTVVNPFDLVSNNFQLSAYIEGVTQSYNTRIVSNDTGIIFIGEKNSSGIYTNIAISDSGTTTLTVYAEILDGITGTVYRTFSKDFDVTVTRIVTDIYISAPNVPETSDPVGMTVQDSYTNGVLGAEVHFRVSEGAADGRIQLAVTEVDGAVNSSGTSNDIVIYVNNQEYHWGDYIPDDSTFYVALRDESTIERNFVLELRANTYDENMPMATNQITFTIDAGVIEINPARDVVAVTKGDTAQILLNFVTTAGEGRGSPRFTYTIVNGNIASIVEGDNYIYTVTGLAEGNTTVLFEAESGADATVEIQVKADVSAFYLTIPQDYTVSNILASNWNNPDYVNETDGKIDAGVNSFVIQQNTAINVSYVTDPENVTVNSIVVGNPVSGDTNYVTVENLNGNSFRLIGLRATDLIGSVTVTVSFSYYEQRDGVWETRYGYRTIQVSVYQPISYFYWNDSNRATTIYETLYNQNHLNYEQHDLANTTVSITYNPNDSYFANGGQIVWTTSDANKLTITQTNNHTVTLNAHLTELDTASAYVVYVYATVTEYNRTPQVLTCEITIINPVQISDITVTNYDSENGVRLNDLGTEAKTRFEMNVEITPYNAFNTGLGYKLYNAVYNNETHVYEVGEEYTGSSEDAVVRLDENNPNIIIANKAGRVFVRLYALDGETSTSVNYDEICHTDIFVVVEDGTESNPYTIDTAEEFITIGNSAESMTKHYTVRQSIDLSRYSAYFPLGKDNASNGVFTGTLTSYDYDRNNIKYTITGIPVCVDGVAVGSDIYYGVFAQIAPNSESSAPAISNLDFYFSNGLIDLNNIDTQNIYIGLLAGNITASIENVFVNFSSYTSNALTINNNKNSRTQNIYFGAVAGNFTLADGTLSNISTNIAVNFNLNDATTLIAGGLFGKFSGLELGQESSVINNTYITANRKADTLNDAVGGLIGNLVSGTVKSMQTTGTITASNLNNIGGFVGINYGILGEYTSETNSEYRNLANVRVNGHQNVGGLVGTNAGTIRYSRAENYDSVNVTDGNTLVLVQGVENVGGLVGYNNGSSGELYSGLIMYSYAMSYINRDLVDINTQSTTYSYYGDIIGESKVGGLVGFNKNAQILNSFASLRIQQTTNSGFIGGLIGSHTVNDSESRLFADFAVGEIYTPNANTTEIGELVGYLESNVVIEQQYAFVKITINNGGQNSTLYNLAGTLTNPSSVSASFNYDGSLAVSDLSGNIGRLTLADMQNASIYQKANWGFGEGQEWVSLDDTIGVNNNMPILYDQNGEWLYTQSINSITITPNTYKEDGNRLNTYFGFDYTEGGMNRHGSVVLLDNITPNELNQRVISLYGTENSLFDVVVTPEGIDPEDWQLSVTSSNYDIVEVVQTSQNLIGSYLIFKTTGVVTLTFRSLLNVNAFAEVTINVLGGFEDYNVLDGSDNSIIGQDFYVKTNTGYPLYPQFTQKDSSIGFTETIGIVYSVYNTENIGFEGITYQNGSNAYIPSTTATLLRGLSATDADFISIGMAPYVVLNFGGQTYNYTFTDLGYSFRVKVYDGITGIGLGRVTEAVLESDENKIVNLTVYTDNVETVTIDDVQVVLGEETLSADESEKYITFMNSQTTEDGIVNSYNLQLAEEYRFITENIELMLTFNVRDESGDEFSISLPLTYTPASVRRIDLSHFTYGATSMEQGEAASNLISPGTTGILRIDVSPEYAWYDNVIISSTVDSVSGDYVRMVQLVYRNGVYRTIPGGTIYDEDGNLVAQKVTGIDERGEAYYDGRIFVSTLISTVVTEGTVFYVTVAPVREGVPGYLINPVQIRLVTTFAPYASLTLDSSYSGNIVARGTIANLHLTGVLQNSTITARASYGSEAGLDTLERSTFGTFQTSFMTGNRENVDMIIPFYVGILAAPNNGQITITLEITSRTETGGMLNPLILTITLNIVDYIIDSVYAEGAQNSDLYIGIRNYTTLQANWYMVTPVSTDFLNFFPGGDATAFTNAVREIQTKANAKLNTLNARGNGVGGIWYYNSGGGYAQLNTSHTYSNFVTAYNTFQNGNSYYIIRGRSLVNDLRFRLSFESYYIYDSTTGCYTFATEEDLNDSNQDLLLENYVRLLERDFNVDVINNTNDDSPEALDSAEIFRTMTEGVSYMLTADIYLYNWTPITTAIKSLDGNGYVIYLRSFASNVDTSTANYGLWSTLPSGTVLKNLIVDVSHNIYVDLQNVSNVNFGFIAGINEGVIYNSEVVVTESKEGWQTIYNNTSQVVSSNADFQFGRSIFNTIARGMNGEAPYNEFDTLASTFILTSRTTDSGGTVTSNIGGLVGQNSGSITNSRVGRIDIKNPLGLNSNSQVYARQGLNIFASGNVGGLVGYNTGTISNSYYANGYVVNSKMDIYSSTNTKGARTGGLVAVQTERGRISGSYATGQIDDETARSSLGGVVAYGTIGGLVHSNAGEITNSYSNMRLSSSNGMGGFVYENTGNAIIKYSYSLSDVQTQGLINGVFIGLDNEGNIQDGQKTTVENCYYLTDEDLIVDSQERAIGLTSRDWGDSTGSAFDGFVISNDGSETTWYIDNERTYLGPQLYLANQNFMSHRSGDGEYVAEVGYELGSKNNPDIITSLLDWQDKVFNYTSESIHSSYMTATGTTDPTRPSYEFGEYYVMLLNDINFRGSIDNTTSQTIFRGKLFGNGHIISGMNYTQSSTVLTTPNDFGLFNQLDGATVSNLNLIIDTQLSSRARRIGVLAGSINDSLIENINITGSSRTSEIIGTNMSGALAGFVSGNSQVYNVTSTLSVTSISATAITTNSVYTYYNSDNPYNSTYSYAGGIIGVLDLAEQEDSASESRIRNLLVTNSIFLNNTRYTGSIDIYGEIVGGVIGLIGTNSEAYKVYFNVDSNTDNQQKIRGKNFAGGLVGENRGSLMNSRISIPDEKRMEIDSEILATDDATDYIGYTELFSHEDSVNAIGGLVGLNAGGVILNSYSRVAVMADNVKVAGGLIGLSINAPLNYNAAATDIDPTLAYLRNLGSTNGQLLTSLNAINYTLSGDQIRTDGSFRFGAILTEVYTTGAVSATDAIGGIVGAQIGAPIYTQSMSSTISAINNNFVANDANFVSKLQSSDTYVGSIVGYLGFELSQASNDRILAFVGTMEQFGDTTSGYSLGSVATNIKGVTLNVDGTNLNSVGNLPNISTMNLVSTNFIQAATSVDDQSFNGFNENVWNLDEEKLNHRFPNLSLGYDLPVVEVSTPDEFFDALDDTQNNSSIRIIADLVIEGDDWENYITQTSPVKQSIGTLENPVRGRLEGAVPVVVSGQDTTRAANITFVNFNTTQMDYFHSLFGYTRSFWLINVNFEFAFDFDATIQNVDSFALLAQSSISSNFENVSVSFASSGDSQYTLRANNLNNIAVIAAEAQDCSFSNIRLDVTIDATDFTKREGSSNNRIAIGGLFALGSSSNEITGSNFGNITINYSSAVDYELTFGALAGRSEGILNLLGTSRSEGNIAGTINVELSANNSVSNLYLGGAVGNPSGATVLRNFSTNVDVNLTKSTNNTGRIYIGGVLGQIDSSNITGATSLGDITLNVNGGNAYVGGIAGYINNNQNFNEFTFSGTTTDVANSYGTINILGDNYENLYVGGIYGYTREFVTLSEGMVAPVGQSRSIYNNLYSSASINVDVTATYAYVGGLIGLAEQGSTLGSDGHLTPFTPINNVLRISNVAFVGEVLVNNESTNGASYVGGISGMSYLTTENALSSGVVSFNSGNDARSYVGGIVGFAQNHVVYSVAMSVMQVSKYIENVATNVDAIMGGRESESVLVQTTYYSSEMSGAFSDYGTNLTAANIYSTEYCDLILANLTNWTYSTVETNNSNTVAVLYPTNLASYVDLTSGSELVPVFVENANMLSGFLNADNQTRKTIILSSDVELTSLNNFSLENTRRIIGNGYSFIINNSYQYDAVQNNYGLFAEIPRTSLISNVGINFDTITLTAITQSNIGVLAGTNYGTIYNVTIGTLADYDTDYLSTNNLKTVANFGNGAKDRYTSNLLTSQEIATLRVRTSGSITVNVGGLIGANYGLISGAFTSLDIDVVATGTANVSVGGLSGLNQSASINNSMTNGRINLDGTITAGGLGGTNIASVFEGCIANVNITANTSSNNIGLAFGTINSGIMTGIIVNSNLSSSSTLDEFNALYSYALTNANLASNTAMTYIQTVENQFNQQIWSRSATLNYGYPYLTINNVIDFNTGDGTLENPYEINEAVQLLGLTGVQPEIYYALSRDMLISAETMAQSSQISLNVCELNGMGHTVVIYELPTTENTASYVALFGSIDQNTIVRNIGMAISNDITMSDAIQYNFGTLAVSNYGTITNSFAVSNGSITFTNSQTNSRIGGLVSQNYGDILNSFADVNFVGQDGYFGGLVGVLGADPSQNEGEEDEEETVVRQATISKSFTSGDITLNNSTNSQTSAGGLVGLNYSLLDEGYVIQDCYTYGTCLLANRAGLNLGTIIGYSAVELNTYRTYSYVYTPGSDVTSEYAGLYANLGMVGNQASLTTKDNTSVISVYLRGIINDERQGATPEDVSQVVGISEMRNTILGRGIYASWPIISSTSIWAQNYGVGNETFLPYLRGVTPQDRQESVNSSTDAFDIFDLN